ncbi:hypothetical protein ACFPRL_12315 [Pseudoclavibacter helvolus]
MSSPPTRPSPSGTSLCSPPGANSARSGTRRSHRRARRTRPCSRRASPTSRRPRTAACASVSPLASSPQRWTCPEAKARPRPSPRTARPRWWLASLSPIASRASTSVRRPRRPCSPTWGGSSSPLRRRPCRSSPASGHSRATELSTATSSRASR